MDARTGARSIRCGDAAKSTASLIWSATTTDSIESQEPRFVMQRTLWICFASRRKADRVERLLRFASSKTNISWLVVRTVVLHAI